MDVIEEFNKLRQTGDVGAYQRRFEELRSLMINHNPYLSEAYFVSSFMTGLSNELRPMVNVRIINIIVYIIIIVYVCFICN